MFAPGIVKGQRIRLRSLLHVIDQQEAQKTICLVLVRLENQSYRLARSWCTFQRNMRESVLFWLIKSQKCVAKEKL